MKAKERPSDEVPGLVSVHIARPWHTVEKQLSPKGSPFISHELMNSPALGPETLRASASTGCTVSTSTVVLLDTDNWEKPKKLTARIKLKNFVIPNTELIPEEVRSKVKKWSDYIDYWAIDWDFQNDTFMQGWVNYRTRKDRSLALVSDPHEYEKASRYRVLVKVVDIFGNDTTQAFDVDVK